MVALGKTYVEKWDLSYSGNAFFSTVPVWNTNSFPQGVWKENFSHSY